MGKKLTAEKIAMISNDDLYQTFDICCKCDEVELGGSMRSLNEDLNDERLICDECLTETERES